MKTKPILVLLFSAAMAHAQPDGVPDPGPPPNLLTRYEAFSMDMKRAAEMGRGSPPDQELYASIVAALEKGEVVQESLMVLRSASGRRAVTDSSREIIYPTEYTPVFQKDITSGTPPVSTVTALLGTKFETRETGDRLEIEVLVGQGDAIHLRTVPSHSTFLGTSKYGQGASEAEIPLFSSQRLDLASQLKAGVPFLLGKTTPHVVSGAVTKPDDRVWFSFVTVTFAKK